MFLSGVHSQHRQPDDSSINLCPIKQPRGCGFESPQTPQQLCSYMAFCQTGTHAGEAKPRTGLILWLRIYRSHRQGFTFSPIVLTLSALATVLVMQLRRLMLIWNWTGCWP